jgi:hypothetical protein
MLYVRVPEILLQRSGVFSGASQSEPAAGSPMTVSNFQKLVAKAGETAGLKIKAHPHMLRLSRSEWSASALAPPTARR